MENLKNFLKKRMATLNIVLISKKIGTLKKLPTKFVLHFNYAKGIGGGKSFFTIWSYFIEFLVSYKKLFTDFKSSK